MVIILIKCLIFDLDDTLYYEKTYVLEGFKNISRYLASKYLLDYNEVYEKCIKIFGKDGRGYIFNKLCNDYKVEENIEGLVEKYRDTIPKIELYDESRKILNFAKENNIKLGIITDGCSKVQ